jgi:hypothetical protein
LGLDREVASVAALLAVEGIRSAHTATSDGEPNVKGAASAVLAGAAASINVGVDAHSEAFAQGGDAINDDGITPAAANGASTTLQKSGIKRVSRSRTLSENELGRHGSLLLAAGSEGGVDNAGCTNIAQVVNVGDGAGSEIRVAGNVNLKLNEGQSPLSGSGADGGLEAVLDANPVSLILLERGAGEDSRGNAVHALSLIRGDTRSKQKGSSGTGTSNVVAVHRVIRELETLGKRNELNVAVYQQL